MEGWSDMYINRGCKNSRQEFQGLEKNSYMWIETHKVPSNKLNEEDMLNNGKKLNVEKMDYHLQETENSLLPKGEIDSPKIYEFSPNGFNENNNVNAPLFKEMGAKLRNLFSEGYNTKCFNLTYRSESSKVNITSRGYYNHPGEKIHRGWLSTECELMKNPLTKFQQKWDTQQQISTSIKMNNLFLDGLNSSFLIRKKINSQEDVDINGKVEFLKKKFSLTCEKSKQMDEWLTSGVVNFYKGCFLGVETQFRFSDSKGLPEHFGTKLAIAIDMIDSLVYSSISDKYIYQVGICYDLNENTQIGIDSSWNKEESQSYFGIACRCNFNQNNSIIRAKYNIFNELGLSIEQLITRGIYATVSCTMDLKNIQKKSPHFGFGIEFHL